MDLLTIQFEELTGDQGQNRLSSSSSSGSHFPFETVNQIIIHKQLLNL